MVFFISLYGAGKNPWGLAIHMSTSCQDPYSLCILLNVIFWTFQMNFKGKSDIVQKTCFRFMSSAARVLPHWHSVNGVNDIIITLSAYNHYEACCTVQDLIRFLWGFHKQALLKFKNICY